MADLMSNGFSTPAPIFDVSSIRSSSRISPSNLFDRRPSCRHFADVFVVRALAYTKEYLSGGNVLAFLPGGDGWRYCRAVRPSAITLITRWQAEISKHLAFISPGTLLLLFCAEMTSLLRDGWCAILENDLRIRECATRSAPNKCLRYCYG